MNNSEKKGDAQGDAPKDTSHHVAYEEYKILRHLQRLGLKKAFYVDEGNRVTPRTVWDCLCYVIIGGGLFFGAGILWGTTSRAPSQENHDSFRPAYQEFSHRDSRQIQMQRKTVFADVTGDGIDDILTEWADGTVDYIEGPGNWYAYPQVVYPFTSDTVLFEIKKGKIKQDLLDNALSEKLHLKLEGY